MARSKCPACGAMVNVARINNTAKTVPLEVHTDASSDAPRYKIVGHRPLRVVQVSPNAVGDYHPDHTFDCPGGNAGRR